MSSSQSASERVYQADALKGLAILSVIALHSLDEVALQAVFSWFHIWQAVPLLCVLLGYTGMRTRVKPLGPYLSRRAWRLGVPFAVTWVASLAIGAATGVVSFSPLLLVGLLPATGPGNYFITLLLQFVLLLPALRWLFEKRGPLAGVIFTFIASLAFESAAFAAGLESYLYSASILRYLFAIGLGMWIATGKTVLPLAIPSLVYVAAYAGGREIPFFSSLWQPQNVVSFGYSAAVVEVGLRWLPAHRSLISKLGRASYHVFLVQMLWFGLVPWAKAHSGLALLMTSLVLCPLGGLAFMRFEGSLTSLLRRRLAAATMAS